MPRPSLLLLGSYHMANPGRDLFNVQADDVLAPQRQREIAECVERLARFQPTKVALEVASDQDEALNQAYRQFRADAFDLNRGEAHQLGFRLAAELGHERVYAIDWNEAEGYARTLDEILDFAQTYQSEIHAELLAAGQQAVAEKAALLERMTIRKVLCRLNQPEQLAVNHRIYLRMAEVGAGLDYVGIGWVQGWYARNLRIFVNLSRIITAPGDRVLVIYGLGHIPLLRQFIRDSGQYELASLSDYLC